MLAPYSALEMAPFRTLLTINYLNAGLHEVTSVEPPPYLDVNRDNRVSPVDALLIINYLNSSSREQGEGRVSGSEWKPSIMAV